MFLREWPESVLLARNQRPTRARLAIARHVLTYEMDIKVYGNGCCYFKDNLLTRPILKSEMSIDAMLEFLLFATTSAVQDQRGRHVGIKVGHFTF